MKITYADVDFLIGNSPEAMMVATSIAMNASNLTKMIVILLRSSIPGVALIRPKSPKHTFLAFQIGINTYLEHILKTILF